MERRALSWLAAVGLVLSSYGSAMPTAAPRRPHSEQLLAQQVYLDRAHFSPGEIDGVGGPNTTRAASAFAKVKGMPVSEALAADATPATTEYVITDGDLKGPFIDAIPEDMMAKAQLPALSFTSVVEALGERFHASPALLRRLNPRVRFAAGDTVVVPNVVTAADASPESRPAANRPHVVVTVPREASALTVTDEAGQVIYHAPATTGSEHDPLPIGEWKVTGVARNPRFSYNPALFWDADPSHAKATIPPGPNGPVGVVWIDLSKPHYGIHGTPEPRTIGHTESHGCVRLTNWDAAAVANLVTVGTKVVFIE
jgi:lipoprotein-anchoring transpeptidase ErfK/SrfK